MPRFEHPETLWTIELAGTQFTTPLGASGQTRLEKFEARAGYLEAIGE